LLKLSQIHWWFGIARDFITIIITIIVVWSGEGERVYAERLDFGAEFIEAGSESTLLLGRLDPLENRQSTETVEISSPDLEIPDGLLPATIASRPLSWRYADLFKKGSQSVGEMREIPGLIEPIDNLSIIHDDKVEGHIRYFHIAIRDRFGQWLIRLGHYKPLVEDIFSEFNLPNDLVFLSLVESGFNPYAYSRAKATGPWQFMKGTAKLYGLRVDRYVDERRDPIKSTVAAARYLRDLYDLFGAWPLAMAAYNAGEGKVMRALQKAHAVDFWEISRTKHIRRETKEYVPRFMAATIIAKNPSQYGFAQDQSTVHQFEEIIIDRPIHLHTLSTASGVSFVELRSLNPELRLDVTPPDVQDYHLKIPVGTKAIIDRVLGKVPSWKPSPTFFKKKEKVRTVSMKKYKVQIGDSVRTIAKRVHLSVQELKARNSFASRGIKPGDLLAIGPPR
jgi:membrane-bound lytic murein transglycosylase D